jgi:A/G-specific adenine glycosylase
MKWIGAEPGARMSPFGRHGMNEQEAMADAAMPAATPEIKASAPDSVTELTPSSSPASTPEAPIFDAEAIAAMRRSLLRWYDDEHRPLPWRAEPSVYKTVVSEFMLQQTQVVAVIPFFESFIKRFSSFRELAEADESDVLMAWSGLGYYRRARNLKRVAEILVREHGGRLPRDPEALAKLPGFGAYTVGAVGSIALGLTLPLVDGNVRRVVARLGAIAGDLTRGTGRRRLWATCETLVDPARPGDFNQGLMEVGATVCLPREPLCLVCPLFEHCRGLAAGDAEAFPAPTKRPKLQRLREVAVALMRGDQVLVVRRGDGGAFAGLWELPRLDSRQIPDPDALTPERVLFDLTRVRIGRSEQVGRAVSAFTRYKIDSELYQAKAIGSQRVRRQRHVAHKWIGLSKLASLPAGKAQRRLFAMLKPLD